jgi:acetylornithine deacetylase/succinyl-diaminopimelate desuccinylase-like protein
VRIEPGRVVALTTALVGVPSHHGDERHAQEVLAALLTHRGFECRLREVAPGRPNLIAVRGSGGPFICSHIDTQLPFDEPEPFVCRESEGRLYGRGVLDAKGQIAALVAAAEAVPDAPATIAICCDEEFTGLGSRHIELPTGLDRRTGGIVLEPTGFRVCHAEAGNVEVRLHARGAPVHMAEPEMGASALDILRDALSSLDRCSFLDATHLLFPKPWSHVGRTQGGEHLWRIPGHATAEASLCVLPGVDAFAARDEVARRLHEVNEGWRARGGSLRFELPTDDELNRSFEVPADLRAASALREVLGDGYASGGMRSWTDAANLLEYHSLPCVIFGAGELWPAHSDREWVELSDLVRLSEVLASLLRRY